MLSARQHVRTVLRIEGLFIALLAVYFYHQFNAGWSLFCWLFFLPDLALVAYLTNAKIGAICYNCTHSIIGPSLLLSIALLSSDHRLWEVALIWFAHIGFDRALGYGLKYSDSFNNTHLGVIGKKAD